MNLEEMKAFIQAGVSERHTMPKFEWMLVLVPQSHDSEIQAFKFFMTRPEGGHLLGRQSRRSLRAD